MNPIDIRPMTLADVDFALRVGGEAGWNQLASDWERTLCYAPQGCFLASWEGKPAGTVTTTSYATDLAWIGMMLVDPQFRRRGIARQLMERSIAYLQSHGVQCIKLDATPHGRLVYQQLGFQDEWEFHRWHRPAHSGIASSLPEAEGSRQPATAAESVGAETLEAEPRNIAAMHPLDCQAFGVDRRVWLQALAQQSTCVSNTHGFGMRRCGRVADYLGPIVADNPLAAAAIVQRLSDGALRDLFWDIPGDNPVAVELARQLGFTPVRTLVRMGLGQPLRAARPECLFGLADPACG